MRRNITLTIFLIMLALLCLAWRGNAQSFERARGYSIHAPEGHNKQCKAVHHKKTFAQKTHTKVKYNRKRHNNEAFANRERRKAIKRNGI